MGVEGFENIFKKKFNELSPEEREQLKGLVDSEEEFDGMKFFYGQLESTASESLNEPSPRLKESLDNVFYNVHPKDRGVGLWASLPALFPSDKKLWQQPMVRIAALLVIALIAIPFFKFDKDEPIRMAKNELPTKELNENKEELVADELSPVERTTEPESNEVENNPPVLFDGEFLSEPSPSFRETDLDSRSFLFMDMSTASEAPVTALNSSATGFAHPDGVYLDNSTTTSAPKPVSENLAILDLLTATF